MFFLVSAVDSSDKKKRQKKKKKRRFTPRPDFTKKNEGLFTREAVQKLLEKEGLKGPAWFCIIMMGTTQARVW